MQRSIDIEDLLGWTYPKNIFIEPDLDAVRTVLDEAGISMDALHGTWARHLVEGIGEMAGEALAGCSQLSQPSQTVTPN